MALASSATTPPATWDVTDFEFWNQFSTASRFSALFQRALKEKLIICIPPDCAVAAAGGVSDHLVTWHLLQPDRRFNNRAICLANKQATVELSPGMLATTGEVWKVHTAINVVTEEHMTNSDREPVRLLMLDRSLLSEADTFVPSMKQFGSPGHCVHDAMDFLYDIDRGGQLIHRLTAELSGFRDSFESIPGFEDDLFRRVLDMCSRHTTSWMSQLSNRTFSTKRFRISVTLAIESFVHAKLYQLVFPQICQLTSADEESAKRHINAFKAKHGTVDVQLSQFGVPASMANLELTAVGRAIHSLNHCITPFDKLQCLAKIDETIAEAVPPELKHELSADVMFPMLSYCLVKWIPKDLCAHLYYLSRFMDRDIYDGTESDYRFVQFQAAVMHLTNGGILLSDSQRPSQVGSRASLRDSSAGFGAPPSGR